MRYIFDEPAYLPDGGSVPDANRQFEELEQCPVCASSDVTPIFKVSGSDGSTANRGAFCNGCEHTYKSRRPSTAWYGEYYRDDWDVGVKLKPAASLQQQARSLARSLVVPSRLISFYDKRSQSGHVKGMRILPMLTGIATGDSYGLRPDPEVRSVIEIGAGYGSALKLFQELGLRAAGLETSRARAESCKAQGLDVTHCAIEEAATVIKGGPFDLLYSAHVFEHILAPTEALRASASLIRDGGFIYVEVPSVNEGEGLMKFAHEATHVHAFSAASLARMLRLAGFEVIRVRTGATLHAVGVKAKPGKLEMRGSADRDSLTRGADRLQKSGRVQVSFSSRDLIVTSTDGQVLHEDRRHFHREDAVFRTIGGRLEPHSGEVDLCSPGPAPIWIKRQ